MPTSKQIIVRVLRGGKENSGEYGSSENLLDYLTNRASFAPAAPCGGRGRCGKCRVTVMEGAVSPPTEEERRLLGEENLRRGVRLACLTRPLESVVLVLEEEAAAGGDNKSALLAGEFERSPGICKETRTLPAPTLEDQSSDHARLSESFGLPKGALSLAQLRRLPGIVRADAGRVTLCTSGGRVLAAEAGDTRGALYGLAVDIGTTTVAAYLVDLLHGKNIDVLSGLNAQSVYGADVISRIHYAASEADGPGRLKKRILAQIDGLLRRLAERNGLDPKSVYAVTLAGNTTMLHLALGLPSGNIAQAPFIPATTEQLTLRAGDLPLGAAEDGLVSILPGVSGYVGADITAAVLASGMAEARELSLLIDIGTNGEIVLGNSERLVSCSTAAGPAFEGAQIRNGVGGVEGAVNKVERDGDSFRWTTIAGEKPLGICGSGIADALALLLEEGIVDETGRMLDPNDPFDLKGRPLEAFLRTAGGEPAFLLVPKEAAMTGDDILFTQKDVREIQLAKAAVAAGIDTLARKMGVSPSDIGRLYLAGGFGSYIDKASAVGIGLLPPVLRDRIDVIGNAAGKGAVMALLSERLRDKCRLLAESMEYLELSSSPEFQEAYIDHMGFETKNYKNS